MPFTHKKGVHHKGHPMSPTVRAKISHSLKGHHHSHSAIRHGAHATRRHTAHTRRTAA